MAPNSGWRTDTLATSPSSSNRYRECSSGSAALTSRSQVVTAGAARVAADASPL
jgi:hypothetical protein